MMGNGDGGLDHYYGHLESDIRRGLEAAPTP